MLKMIVKKLMEIVEKINIIEILIICWKDMTDL